MRKYVAQKSTEMLVESQASAFIIQNLTLQWNLGIISHYRYKLKGKTNNSFAPNGFAF
jgi:hypothetical protein